MSCGWFHPPVDSSSGGWTRFAADSILRLDTSSSWLHPTAASSSGSSIRLTADSSCGWLRVVADSILWLTWVPPAGFKMWLAYTLIYQVNIELILQNTSFFVFYRLISVATDSGFGCYFKNLEAAWRSVRKLQEASRI